MLRRERGDYSSDGNPTASDPPEEPQYFLLRSSILG